MPVDNVPIDRTGAACPVAWCPQRRGRRARRGGRARAPLSARRAPALPVVPGKMRYSAWTGATRIAVSSPRPPSVGPCARPKGDHRARARHTLFETVALPHLKVDGDVHAASPSARGVHGFVVAQERQVDKPAAALSFTADGIHDGLTVRRTVVLTVAQRGDGEGRAILCRCRRAAAARHASIVWRAACHMNHQHAFRVPINNVPPAYSSMAKNRPERRATLRSFPLGAPLRRGGRFSCFGGQVPT